MFLKFCYHVPLQVRLHSDRGMALDSCVQRNIDRTVFACRRTCV